MTSRSCARCGNFFKEIIREYCRKCYYALKYKGELSNVEKPNIDSFTEVQKELLIGSLLGDAWIGRNATTKYAHLKIERSYKDVDYLKYEYEILKPFCKSGVKDYLREDCDHHCYFITRSYKILNQLCDEWYPEGTKVVPNDIKLTPLVVAIWLCDDGNISIHHKNQGLLRTNFATNGFSLKEVELLSSLLSKRYKENFRPNKTKIPKQYVINADDTATRTMWEDIKEVFPESMARKYTGLLEK